MKPYLFSCTELVTAGVLTCVWLKTPLVLQDFIGMELILSMVAFLAVQGRAASVKSKHKRPRALGVRGRLHALPSACIV